MRVVRKWFSSTYPYHASPKHSVQTLVDFPLQFGTREPGQPEHFSPQEIESSLHETICTYYSHLLQGLSTQNFEKLEGCMEHNLLTRLKSYSKELAENKYTIKVIGEAEDTHITRVNVQFYSGSVLPYRNLNFPSEYYDVKDLSKGEVLCKHFLVRSPFPLPKSFDEFQDLDLHRLNTTEDLAPYRDKFLQLLSLLQKFPILVKNEDFCVHTPLKINVFNEAGELVDGIDNPLTKEFHCIRAESIIDKPTLLTALLVWRRGQREFVLSQLKPFIDKPWITDLDGYMHGNLMIHL